MPRVAWRCWTPGSASRRRVVEGNGRSSGYIARGFPAGITGQAGVERVTVTRHGRDPGEARYPLGVVDDVKLSHVVDSDDTDGAGVVDPDTCSPV